MSAPVWCEVVGRTAGWELLLMQRTAYHEAGHAVVHLLHGTWFAVVYLRHDFSGSVDLIHVRTRSFTSGCREDDRALRRAIDGCLAGQVAEQIFIEKARSPGKARRLNATDRAAALDFIARTRGVCDPRVVLRDRQRRVLALLRRPAVWRAVEAVATALLERGTLLSTECAELLGVDPTRYQLPVKAPVATRRELLAALAWLLERAKTSPRPATPPFALV